MSWVGRRFSLSRRETTARTEALGGTATFLTMSYILFVNPAILSAAGMPFDAVAVATVIAAAVTTAAMALATNVPFAPAPGPGINAVVAIDIVLGRGLPWRVGMAIVVIEGLVALVLVLAGLRTAIMEAVPLSLRLAIGVGIGLFITLVGLREGGVVGNNPATGIGLGDLTCGPALISLAGVMVAAVLVARGVRGAVILGVFAATVLGLVFGELDGPDGVIDAPGSDSFSTIGDALDPNWLGDALTVSLIPVIFALFMTDFFETIGTAVAVGRAGGLTDEHGRLPNSDRLLLVDSGAASLGGAMGTSSVTTCVESGAGVAEGARTGLVSLVTAGWFVLAVFFVPIIALVGQDVQVGEETFIHPAVAPALVMAGYLMIRIVADIDWTTPESALPRSWRSPESRSPSRSPRGSAWA
jgi:adenine/guanine/hypoxanthine permease